MSRRWLDGCVVPVLLEALAVVPASESGPLPHRDLAPMLDRVIAPAPGLSHTIFRRVGLADTAATVGNEGVDVLATTTLILWIETAANDALGAFYQPGEGSVGTRIAVDHLGAALVGDEVVVRVEVSVVDGRRITFAAEARVGDRVVLAGTHDLFVVDLARFRERLAASRDG